MNGTNKTHLRDINQAQLKYLILSELDKHNKAISQGELVKLVAKELGLTQTELDDHYDRKSDKIFYKMVATNEQRLQAAGLETFTKSGHSITKEGKEALEDKENKKSKTITYEYLRGISQYNDWEKRLNIAPKKIENDWAFVAPSHPNPHVDIPIGLEYDETQLLKEVERIRKDFKNLEWYYRASEENARAELIEPILKALGWVAPYIRREERHMDYLLCAEKMVNKSSPKIVIEAKRYFEQLKTTGQTPNNDNEIQLLNYCGREEALAGILTNGIKWCIYLGAGYEYKGEIDISSEKFTDEEIRRFFSSFSITNFLKINQLDWNWLSKTKEDETHPTRIIINGNHTDGKKQCDVFYDMICEFIDRCTSVGNCPSDFQFFKEIIIEKKGRKKAQFRPHGKYFINTKSGIFEKIALLQEINSTLDLYDTIEAR